MKICASQKHEKLKGGWLVCLPGSFQGFHIVISQGGPEVEPMRVPVAGSPPADQHKL